MTYTDWLAIGAMAIAILSAWYGKRQAEAAEHANRLAAAANARADELQQAMAYRWEIIPDNDALFRFVNMGTADAYYMRIWLPEHLKGSLAGEHPEKMAPQTHRTYIIEGKSEGNITGPIKIRWEDRTGKTPQVREVSTSLPMLKNRDKPWDGTLW